MPYFFGIALQPGITNEWNVWLLLFGLLLCALISGTPLTKTRYRRVVSAVVLGLLLTLSRPLFGDDFLWQCTWWWC